MPMNYLEARVRCLELASKLYGSSLQGPEAVVKAAQELYLWASPPEITPIVEPAQKKKVAKSTKTVQK